MGQGRSCWLAAETDPSARLALVIEASGTASAMAALMEYPALIIWMRGDSTVPPTSVSTQVAPPKALEGRGVVNPEPSMVLNTPPVV
ncbi:MAG: hypothetical protein HYX78_15860 [Armatimonadetes bacterium]|nr:hypothetical protein [Armatimonadota bacterium]